MIRHKHGFLKRNRHDLCEINLAGYHLTKGFSIQSWTLAGLFGSGSGWTRAVIFKLFRAFFGLIFSMTMQNIFILFLIFLLYFLSESVFCSKHSLNNFFYFAIMA